MHKRLEDEVDEDVSHPNRLEQTPILYSNPHTIRILQQNNTLPPVFMISSHLSLIWVFWFAVRIVNNSWDDDECVVKKIWVSKDWRSE